MFCSLKKQDCTLNVGLHNKQQIKNFVILLIVTITIIYLR